MPKATLKHTLGVLGTLLLALTVIVGGPVTLALLLFVLRP